MNRNNTLVIRPDIFNGDVKAFFTKKSVGTDINRLSGILSIRKLDVFLPVQKHTDEVLVLSSDPKPEIADAVITNREGILIGVQVADCVPILLFDEKNSVIGAVHAGWRGTAAGIVKKTMNVMSERFGSLPPDIRIALGPSIRWGCYEVDREVKDAVCEASGDGEYFFEGRGGKCSVDLCSANICQALSAGIPEENIWSSDECTYCNPGEYYSYRYDKVIRGSQGGFIGILDR